MLVARSVAEAHLYMDLQGCEPGTRGHSLEARGDELVSVYRCQRGDEQVSYEFLVLDPVAGPGSFGGPAASTLLGPGDFLSHADAIASSVPASGTGLSPEQRRVARERLYVAVACVEEVLRFAPEGADAVPAEAFRSDRDRALLQADPARFRRARLRQVADTLRRIARGM